jgi:hypothetical protein
VEAREQNKKKKSKAIKGRLLWRWKGREKEKRNNNRGVNMIKAHYMGPVHACNPSYLGGRGWRITVQD